MIAPPEISGGAREENMSSKNNDNNSSGKKKKKVVAAAVAVALAAVLMIGGTISYLQSASKEVVNKFSTNNDVGVDLEETTEGYEIIPGTTQDKDPTVYVDATLDSFVFLVVTDATGGLVNYEIDTSVWTLLSETTENGVTTYVYYHLLDVSTESAESSGSYEGSYKYGVLVDDQVSYSSSITNEDLEGVEDITLTFQAYAIQAEPFYSNTASTDDEGNTTYDVTSAAEAAWLAVNGVSSSDDLEEAIESGVSVALTSDITLTDTLEVDSEVTIDLAGYSITNSSGTAIEVTEDGDLTITDSSENGSGTISGTVTSESAQYVGGAITVSGGDLTVESGTITGTISGSTSSASYNAGAIYVEDGGLFEFTGGTISGSSSDSYQSAGAVYVNASTFTMGDGATISGCSSTGSKYCAGAVVLAYGSIFNMEGGTISGCTATSSNYNTGGVAVLGKSTFNMSGGTITDCTGYRGGAVLIADASKVTLSGGSITGNTANYSGGGIYMYDDGSSFEMSGGSITSNTCSSGKGGGIRACSGTYVTITGGTISGNTASSGNNAYIDSGCTLSDDGDILTDYYDGDSTSTE